MEAERTALIVKAYPRLKSFCLARNHELRIMDPHWGSRDMISDDHSLNAMLIKLIDQTVGEKKASMINFMVRLLIPISESDLGLF